MRRLFALLLILCFGSARAEEREKGSVRVDVQVVAIDPKSAITLIPELQRADTADRATEKVQAMIEDEKAELLAWPCATASSGGIGISGGGDEYCYPEYEIDFSPPFHYNSPVPAIKYHWLPDHSTQHWGARTPWAFDVRQAGPVLTIQPTIPKSDPRVAVAIMIRHGHFERFKEFHGTPAPGKLTGVMTVAEFRSQTFSSAFTADHDKRMLLTSFVEQHPKPRVILPRPRQEARGSALNQEMKTFLQLLIAFVWIVGSGQAQGPLDFEDPQPKHNISAEMQVVAIPRAAALPLMRDLLDPGKIEPAYERIQQMLVAGTAKLVGWPTLKTHSGSRATVECVNDFRYATEFAGGGVDIYLTADGRDFLKQDAKIKGVELNVVPTAFETQPLGLTFELEPVLSPDGQMIEVNVVTRNVWLKEMRLETIERGVEEKITVEQPVLGMNNITTSLSLKNGQRILLGSFANSETPNHMELFLLKVEAQKK